MGVVAGEEECATTLPRSSVPQEGGKEGGLEEEERQGNSGPQPGSEEEKLEKCNLGPRITCRETQGQNPD